MTELDLFFQVWQEGLGPTQTTSTEDWLYSFGYQTKWLAGDSWTWWIERFKPPVGIDVDQAKNFVSLVIGMLGNRTNPQGEAVRYARQLAEYLENSHED